MIKEGQLKAMKERAEKATPGPWSVFEIIPGFCCLMGGEVTREPRLPGTLLGSCGPANEHETRSNFAFLAEARQDIPDLIAEVRRQRARIAALEARRRELQERLAALRGLS